MANSVAAVTEELYLEQCFSGIIARVSMETLLGYVQSSAYMEAMLWYVCLKKGFYDYSTMVRVKNRIYMVTM